MIGSRRCCIVVALFVVSLLTLGGWNLAYAADHTITINNTNLSHNQNIIFDEKDIEPGFAASYSIRVDNQSTEAVKVGLHDIQEDAANSMSLNELQLTFSYNGTDLIHIDPNSVQEQDFICIGPHTNDLFNLSLSMDEALGNEYQDKSFLVNISFQGNAADCEDTPPGLISRPDDKTPNLPLLPNTGEDRAIYYFLYGAIIVFALLTIIFLIFLIIARRRDHDNKGSQKALHEKDRI